MDISVVIPLYNKKDSVLRAINSVLAQTSLPNEIIVVNDGSTDGSEKIVELLNHPLIRLVHQENAGVSAARNKGIELAQWEWIAFLDADDIWLEDYMEEINKLNENYSNSKVLATNYLLEDVHGNQRSTILRKMPFRFYGILANYFEVAANSHPPIWSSAVVIDRKILQAIGGFPLGIISGEDLITWAKLASQHEIAYSLKPLAIFYQEASHNHNEKPKRYPAHPDIVYNELKKLLKSGRNVKKLAKYIAHWKLMRANIYIRFNASGLAVREILSAIRFNPFKLKAYVFLFIAVLPLKDKNSIFRRFSK